jgi:hypothetical protein
MGLTILLVAVTGITTLVVLCYRRILGTPRDGGR